MLGGQGCGGAYCLDCLEIDVPVLGVMGQHEAQGLGHIGQRLLLLRATDSPAADTGSPPTRGGSACGGASGGLAAAHPNLTRRRTQALEQLVHPT